VARPRIAAEYRGRVSTIRRTPQHSATVIAVCELTPRMRRLTVSAPTLRDQYPRPAQDVEVLLTDDTGRRVKRRYTIRHSRSGLGEFDLDALLHGTAHSPGARWAATAQPGDAIAFVGPRGRLELTDADWHLFVGDEAGLPAIAASLESLPEGSKAVAFIEIHGPADQIELLTAADLELHWLHRGAADAGTTTLLDEAVRSMDWLPGRVQAFVHGESALLKSVRPHVLNDRGVARPDISVSAYWRRGTTEEGFRVWKSEQTDAVLRPGTS
jgi:NADPH-dependent ferric siderophore reductase